MANRETIKQERLKKIQKIKNLRINPYPHNYQTNTTFKKIIEKHKNIKPEQTTKTNYKIAGRIILLRNMGKLSFITIQEQTNIKNKPTKIQTVISQSETDDKSFQLTKLLDLGDIIGVQGYAFKTKKGELSLMTRKLTILTKALQDSGEKYHGVKDIETRYRNRTLDMISNPEVIESLKNKHLIIQKIREHMIKQNFLEVETPILQQNYGGDEVEPFETYYNDLKQKTFLRISPEQSLKKIIAGGMEAIFELSRNFRNESIDTTHNPEFSMLEAYRTYEDYNYMMKLMEQLAYKISKEMNGTSKITFKGQIIDLKPPWKKMTIKEAIQKTAKINIETATDKELIDKAKRTGKQLIRKTREEAIIALHEEYGEKITKDPIHFIDYPKGSTVFAKEKRNDPNLIERAETFIGGVEIANMYSELNDPYLQRKHMQDQMKLKNKTKEIYGELDETFLTAMDLGMPPTAGIGIGIDRLAMIILNKESIRDTLYFPAMKTKKK